MEKCMPSEMIGFVKAELGQEELLCQLAEEASELARAALKLRRVYDGKNPTPVTEEEALENLREEIADVWLVLDALEMNKEFIRYGKAMNRKTERWYNRIKNSIKKNGE